MAKIEQNKSFLKTLIEKVKSASTLATAICAIVSFLWLGFREIENYNNQKVEVKVTQEQLVSMQSQLKQYVKATDSLKLIMVITKNRLDVHDQILNDQLIDVIYEGVRYKQTIDHKYFFYYDSGNLYTVYQNQSKYYYYDENNKATWCK